MGNKKRLHFGVIISSFDNTIQYDIWNGVVSYARQHDIQLTAYFAAYQTTTLDVASHFETCYNIIQNSSSLDGIILFSGFIANIMGKEAFIKFAIKMAWAYIYFYWKIFFAAFLKNLFNTLFN